jgi:hypothetical protein
MHTYLMVAVFTHSTSHIGLQVRRTRRSDEKGLLPICVEQPVLTRPAIGQRQESLLQVHLKPMFAKLDMRVISMPLLNVSQSQMITVIILLARQRTFD